MTKREAMRLQAKLSKHLKQVAKDRDAIDETISELYCLKDCCDRAYDALYEARDALSELV